MGSVKSIGKKTKVHVSFAEADLPFVEKLLAALDRRGEFELSITPDQPDAVKEASDLIAAADAVVFVLSPAASETPTVAQEAKLAQEMSKKVLAVLSQPIGRTGLPALLPNIKPIALNAHQAFIDNMKVLVQALEQDHEWIQKHTALYARARQWQAAGHDPGLLLAGSEVTAAKIWTFERPDKAPKPTDLHIDFIRKSGEPELSLQTGPVDAADDVGNSEGGELQGETEQLPVKVQPTASKFTTLLWPWSRHTPSPNNKELADTGPAPDPTVKAEQLSVQEETTAKADPPLEEPQDHVSEQPELLPEPDDWLRDMPASAPAVVARTRQVTDQLALGQDLDQLVRAPTGKKITQLAVEHVQPYHELTKPVSTSRASNIPRLPTVVSCEQESEANFVRAKEPLPARPKPGTCPWAPRVGAQPPAPHPGNCPVAPLSPVRPKVSSRARSLMAPVPKSSPSAPKPCVTKVPPDPDKSRPAADPPPPEPCVRLLPKPSPPVSKPYAAPTRSCPTSAGPATVELVPSVRVKDPAAASAECPATKKRVKPPLARPQVAVDDQLDDLLASFLGQDDDTLKF